MDPTPRPFFGNILTTTQCSCVLSVCLFLFFRILFWSLKCELVSIYHCKCERCPSSREEKNHLKGGSYMERPHEGAGRSSARGAVLGLDRVRPVGTVMRLKDWSAVGSELIAASYLLVSGNRKLFLFPQTNDDESMQKEWSEEEKNTKHPSCKIKLNATVKQHIKQQTDGKTNIYFAYLFFTLPHSDKPDKTKMICCNCVFVPSF